MTDVVVIKCTGCNDNLRIKKPNPQAEIMTETQAQREGKDGRTGNIKCITCLTDNGIRIIEG
jgi:hypothetical protein